MEVSVESKQPSPRERKWAGALVRAVFLRKRRGGPWPVPDWLPYESVRFEGNTGAQLAGRWFPAAEPRGVVVLAHPDRRYGQHWFVHTGWVDFLHDRGYHVLTFDFPDYGESRGGSTYYFEDVIAACTLARRRAEGLPIHLVGVSLGAFAVANATPHLDFIESIVLESPYTTFNDWYGGGPALWTMRLFDRMFPRTAALIHADRSIARTTAKRVLVVASTDDEVTRVELSRRVAAAAPRARYLEFSGHDHLALFAAEPQYRAAILETLGFRTAHASATATTHPQRIRASASTRHLGASLDAIPAAA